jgi:hypothetical protein
MKQCVNCSNRSQMTKANEARAFAQQHQLEFGAEVMTARDFIGKKVGEMTGREFSRWVDLGRPPLTAPEPPKQQRTADDVAQLVRQEVDAAIGVLCDVIGQETGRNEKALREEIGKLRAEVEVLRGQLPQLRQQMDNLQREHVTIDLPPLLGARTHGQH